MAEHLRRLLDCIIISDIERICAHSEAHHRSLVNCFDYLKMNAEQGDRYAIGAPLYYWLSNAPQHFKHDALVPYIDKLIELMVGQLIITIKPDEQINLAIPHAISHIPQADYVFSVPVYELSIGYELLILHCIDGRSYQVNTADIRQLIDIRKANTNKVEKTDIIIHSHSSVLNEYLAELDGIASKPINNAENLHIRMPHEPEVDVLKDGLKNGVELIIKSGQERFDEVNVLMDAIALLSGDRFVGGSDIAYHGVAFLNLDLQWSKYTFADHLIHESAHILLHTANEVSPVLKNPDFYGAPSPIRKDPRPMIGILHSTFVFMRLVMFFKHQVQFSKEDEVYFRLHRHLLGFIEGMDSLSKYASFTEEGQALYAGMCHVLDWFKRTLPEPDPAYYKRVGNDYVV
ncbi:HEXXH motif-containing putative peptide modification protein [Marinicella sediminis]|uniref:HEXXH motif-containing putative peptide modification protein n=2 Tax=Marinicella sediminis TaxID=1792834 RepID=A0ABV7JBH0_9GAMM